MVMYFFLVEFKAEYYCQGFEWATFTRLVRAKSFDDACEKISDLHTKDWQKGTPKDFKNLTIL